MVAGFRLRINFAYSDDQIEKKVCKLRNYFILGSLNHRYTPTNLLVAHPVLCK